MDRVAMSKLRIALWVVVAIALFVIGALAVGQYSFFGGRLLTAGSELKPGAPLGGPFKLVDEEGAPVTEAIFREKPSVTLFGYTHCPDVCPTGLSEMGKWAEELGPDADKLRFVFVTVDPERDTPETMRDYVTAFSDRIVGISGAPDAVHAMVKDYKIYSRKVPLEGGDYSMDHTASMILQDAKGNFVGTIDTSESHAMGLAKLKHLVAE
jgi:protein SCO1/2